MTDDSLKTLALCGGQVVTPAGSVGQGTLLIHGSKIAAVGETARVELPAGLQVIDTSGCQVLPGFIDTHVHGCLGDEVMDGDPERILRMAEEFCRQGVTSFLATTVAAPHKELIQVLQACWRAAEAPRGKRSRILGIHIEGPFINVVRKGAQPEEGIRNPDLEQCREYLEAGGGFVRMMTLAPELPGGKELIRLLCENRVVPSMGHTDAEYETAVEAVHLGASNATHLFNQMPPLHHRKPGLAAACLNEPGVTVELITDGVHLDPAIVKLAIRHKGCERVCLITDSIAAQGMPDGEYRLGSHRVYLREGRCTLEDGTLAGSVHRMDRALHNTMQFSGCSLEEASCMASAVPARTAGVSGCKGALEPGKDADVVVVRDGVVELTMVEGQIVYRRW